MARRIVRGRPGPKAGFANPHPREPDFDWIPVEWLDDAEQAIRKELKRDRLDLTKHPTESEDHAVRRIRRLATNAADHSGAVWWSDLPTMEITPQLSTVAASGVKGHSGSSYVMRHVGATPPQRPGIGSLWIDTSSRVPILKEFLGKS